MAKRRPFVIDLSKPLPAPERAPREALLIRREMMRDLKGLLLESFARSEVPTLTLDSLSLSFRASIAEKKPVLKRPKRRRGKY